MKVTTTVKDPVCGMDVDPEAPAGQSEYKGKTFYFCGSACKTKFDASPEQFAAKYGKA